MTVPLQAPDGAGLRTYAHEWALVDVETSGLVPRRDRVLSLAVITLDQEGRRTGEFTTLLDPGCDPGPVEIHGLTAERLRGAPTFDRVVDRVAALLRDRVMVAHNAQFDYDFLAHEFARAGQFLPVAQRLCTLALNRRVDPPTEDLRLGTLAAYYGVTQLAPHDAADDTRVLEGVLRATLGEARHLGLELPLVACPPRQEAQFAPQPRKKPCAFRNPGPLPAGGPLTQGMKVAITGETATARTELAARAVAAGLNLMNSVSRHTSVLVTNDLGSGSGKARRAVADGVPVVDERTFLALLADVRPGVRHDLQVAAVPAPRERQQDAPPPEPSAAPSLAPSAAAEPSLAPSPAPVSEPAPAAPGATAPAPAAPPVAPSVEAPAGPPPAGPAAAPSPAAVAAQTGRRRAGAARVPTIEQPLVGRRVLVLGGAHEETARARARVTALGGGAAINLSASVSDVVTLPGGEHDRRMRRIEALGLPVHDRRWLDSPPPPTALPSATVPRTPHILSLGAVIDLPVAAVGTGWDLTVSWAQQTRCEIDVVALAVDEDEQVGGDEDFVFYGAPECPDGSVRLLADGPTEQTVAVELSALAPGTRKVVLAAAIDGDATFGDVGAVHLLAAPGPGAAPLAQATLDAATTERTLLLAELYRRGPVWRLRAVGQGYDTGLVDLARGYGVDVADD
ncbi:TerD family protein [Streptomyces lonarensis]|uniref:DNA polymerase III n=1 Tax=Streptomyces lonarensis TaxID=700599 RepID=A0A7X6CZC2_9ACTN|nr:TerD family protein [Streptomyces lonarensis]NJQ05245.1 DNA polymerase III [Streptomyces lonarensis]